MSPEPSRYNDRAPQYLAAREQLVRFIRFGQFEPPRHHVGGTEDALRCQADDLGHVGARARAERADDAQAAAHEPGDLDRSGALARGNADAHHAAAVTDALERLYERLRPPEHLEGDVHADAAGHLADRLHRVHFRRVHHVGGAEPGGGLELVVAHVHGDDLRRAERLGDLHDGEADAAGRYDGDALTAAQI